MRIEGMYIYYIHVKKLNFIKMLLKIDSSCEKRTLVWDQQYPVLMDLHREVLFDHFSR